MNELFINYEESLQLKELGFDEPCFSAYNDIKELSQLDKLQGYSNALFDYVILAPLYSQAFNFFRDKYNLDSHIRMFNKRYSERCYWKISDFNSEGILGYSDFAENYQQVEIDCLNKLISIVKNEYKNT